MRFDMDKVVSEALHSYNDKVTLRFGLTAERFGAAKMEIITSCGYRCGNIITVIACDSYLSEKMTIPIAFNAVLF
jgi:hypothetical protein